MGVEADIGQRGLPGNTDLDRPHSRLHARKGDGRGVHPGTNQSLEDLQPAIGKVAAIEGVVGELVHRWAPASSMDAVSFILR